MTFPNLDMKFEVVVIPVSDVDRAKEFYERLGWRLDADFATGDDFRVIQFTPPGSGCSIIFGKNVTAAAPGSAQGLYLIVSDIEAARDELVAPGVDVSEVFHDAGGVYAARTSLTCWAVRVSGPDPSIAATARSPPSAIPTATAGCCRRSQTRLPGRVDAGDTTYASASDLAQALRRAAAAHGRAREAHGASRRELAGLVRRVHGARAGRARNCPI